MRFTYLFFSILLCLSSYAQPNPINRRAMAIAGLAKAGNNDIPSSILIISNRWMSVHFATNATVADWIDETNSFHMITRGGASSTTNTDHGVWLDGSHCLNATNVFRDQNMVQFFIFQNEDPTASPNRVLFQDQSSGLGYGFILNNSIASAQWGFTSPNPSLTIPGVAVNVFFDCVWTGSGAHFYTNGVDAGTLSQGAPGTTVSVGGSDVPNHGWNGTLREYISFVNTTITAGQISNLHYYATHYPYHNP